MRWMTGKPSTDALVAEKAFSELGPAVQRIDRVHYLVKQGRGESSEAQSKIAAELREQFLKESDKLVRAEILTSIVELEQADAVESTLQAGTSDESPEVRVAACRAWRLYNSDATVTELGRMVTDDEDADVRMAALRELGKMQTSNAVTAIAPALSSRDPAMQYRAVQSLRAVAPVDHGNDVVAWREYVQNSEPAGEENKSIAQRVRRWF